MKANITLYLAILTIILVTSGCKASQPNNQSITTLGTQPVTTNAGITATTKPMGNTLSPARDLTGTWIDIPGEGLVFTIIAGPHRFHDDIRMEIVQKGNTFTGTMWASIYKVDVLNPDVPWDFPLPTEVIAVPVTDGIVSSSDIQFKAMTWDWDGTFTNNIMSGTITGYDPRSGAHYTGEFRLTKK